jgi:nitroreductase
LIGDGDMELIEGIMTRRSIRHFTRELISDEQLDTILRAGFQAPSAHNYQPWEFIVLRDKEKLKTIKDFHRHAKMIDSAGTAIVVCGDNKKQDNRGLLVADTSAAIQNMLLAAHGLGLGAVWCGIYDIKDYVLNLSSLLNLPEHILPVGIVVVGNKIKDRSIQDRYDKNKIHYDSW